MSEELIESMQKEQRWLLSLIEANQAGEKDWIDRQLLKRHEEIGLNIDELRKREK